MNKQSLWIKKGIWLVGLTLFFYTTYNLASYVTLWRAQHEVIPFIMFEWEHKIPLIPWTIVPYWTENLFYGLAILLAVSYTQLKTLGKRLLATQAICVTGFLLFPLQQINIANRPNIEGFFGWLFNELMKFDHPYNQAPSLHIALLVVLWTFYVSRIPKKWHVFLHIWALLIGASVLTTWQHHFIDIPAGVLGGALAIWCFPDNKVSPLNLKKIAKNWRWMMVYLIISIVLTIIAIYSQGAWLWLLYPAFSLLLTSLNYGIFGKHGFPKEHNGQYSLSNLILFLPYILIAKINAKIWTRNNNPYDEVISNLFIGSIPKHSTDLSQFQSVVDCCAEIPFSSKTPHYYPNFLLDMTPLSLDECKNSAAIIHQAMLHGNTLIFCALGYSRSATSIIAYLIRYSDFTVEEAIAQVKKARPTIVINTKQLAILRSLNLYEHNRATK